MVKTLLIRADGGTQMGTGHVMRCLALAQEWQDNGGEVIFVLRSAPAALLERLTAEGCRAATLDVNARADDDLHQTIHCAKQFGAEWVVIDGYQFDDKYQSGIKDSGFRVLWVDDYGHATHYVADIVLNYNLYADQAYYLHRSASTQLLLGPRYVMFRREFRKFKNLKRTVVPRAKHILITLGGSDPHNTSVKILQSVRQALDSYEAVVVAGVVNPLFSNLEDEASRHARSSLKVLARVSDMAKHMAWADMAVSAAGATSYELAFMGLPALMVITADNQRKNADALEAVGISSCLGWHENVTISDAANALRQLSEDYGRRELMGQRGQHLVDGYGVDRVQALLRGQRVRLRTVSGDDCRLLWDWVNDPVVRAMSFSSHLISWEEHQAWFDTRLTDPACRFFIAVDIQDRAVGHIRFESENEEMTVSITVSPDLRGKGFGKEILKIAVEKVMATSAVKVIHGFVKKTNEASLKAFAGAGFSLVAEVVVGGHKGMHFELARRTMP